MSTDLWILFVIITTHEISATDDDDYTDRLHTLQFKNRCTRRFTPGVCIESIQQSWTFNFQLMNCTERLGCPQSLRSNRFTSYEHCMMRCQPMIHLYLQILAYAGETNSKFFLRTLSGRRFFNHQIIDPSLRGGAASKPPALPPDWDYYPGDEALLARVLYPDQSVGLDDEPTVRDPGDYIEVHDPNI